MNYYGAEDVWLQEQIDMLASAKEHEMHRRGQPMLIERMLGITLT